MDTGSWERQITEHLIQRNFASVFGLFTTEVINPFGPWKSKDQVDWEIVKWVDWFNKKCLLEPLGYITPIEAEEKYEQAL